jgi:hypothetical protein
MRETFESRVRKMDDETKRIGDLATILSEYTGRNKNYIKNILYAKRNGFNSHHQYQMDIYGFTESSDYFNFMARKLDFENWASYNSAMKILRKNGDILDISPEQLKFESEIELTPNSDLDRLSQTGHDSNKKPNIGKLYSSLSSFSPMVVDVIRRRYLKDNPQTLEYIGELYDLSGERIRQIEEIALKKLREYYSGISKINDNPSKQCSITTHHKPKNKRKRNKYSEGENKLVHALFKGSNLDNNEVSDLINELFHNNNIIRTPNDIYFKRYYFEKSKN